MTLEETDEIQSVARDLCGLAAALQASEHIHDAALVADLTEYASRRLWELYGSLERLCARPRPLGAERGGRGLKSP